MTHPLHEKALELSRRYLESERHLVEVLGEIDTHKVWRTLGYSSFFEYVSKALSLSDGQTYTLTSVSRKCREIPELKQAILSKTVSISNAKRILPVITPENNQIWINKAHELTTRNLEKEVAVVSPISRVKEEVRPLAQNLSKITFCISDETEILFRHAQDILSNKVGRCLGLEETVKEMAEYVIEKLDKVKKAERMANPTGKALKPIHKRSVPVDSISLNAKSVQSRRPPLAKAIEHQVRLRDRNRCSAELPDGTRCTHTRFLELHHKTPLSRGGIHHVNNLISLCSTHHKLWHERMNEKHL